MKTEESCFSSSCGGSDYFYPFYSQAGYPSDISHPCVMLFGNSYPAGTISGTGTVNDFGNENQYNTGTILSNPCIPHSPVTITTSSSQFYGPALERVLITDTSKNTATDSVVPHVAVKRGSTSLFEQDITVPIIGTSGTFEFYLTTSNSPFKPASPSFTAGSPIMVRISQNPVISSTTEAAAGFGSIPAEYSFPLSASSAPLRDGDTITITYGGQTSVVQFSKSNVIASVDRSSAGDGNRVILTLNDQDANIDPTSVDSFAATPSIVTATGGTLNLTGALFVEEGQNSGSFDLALNVTSANLGVVNPTNGGTLRGALFPSTSVLTLHDFDVYSNVPASATAPYNAIIPNPSVTSSQTITLQNSDGVLALNNPVSIPNGIALQITDPDRNISTKSIDSFNSLVNITINTLGKGPISTGYFASVPMVETGANSGIFVPNLTDNKIPIQLTLGDSFVNNNPSLGPTGIFINATTLAANNNVVITYTDPQGSPDIHGKIFRLITTVSHTAGTLTSSAATVGINGQFHLTISDNDLNTNPDVADSFVVAFSTANSGAENIGQFMPSQSFGSLASLTLLVAGTPVSFASQPLSMVFVETGPNTGIFNGPNLNMSTFNQAYVPIALHGLRAGDQLQFTYHDHSESPVSTSTAIITVRGARITTNPITPTSPVPWGSTLVSSGSLFDSNGIGLASRTIWFDGSMFTSNTINVSIVQNAQNLGSSAFSPNPVNARVGDSVVWTNADAAIHTVTSGNGSTGTPDGIFDSKVLIPGNSFSFTFRQIGDYAYYCQLHPTMQGLVHVSHAATTTTTSTGSFSISLAAPNTVNTSWTLQAHFDGDSSNAGTAGQVQTFDTRKHNTALTLGTIRTSVPWGRPTSFPATLTDLDKSSSAVSGRLVHYFGSGVVSTADATTSTSGLATGAGTAPSSIGTGWSVQAQFTGDSLYNTASSLTRTYRTTTHATSLSLTIQPTSVVHGTGLYSVRGVLRDSVTNTILTSRTITFTATTPIVISSTTTSTTGTYAISNLVAPPAAGTYSITARYSGETLYAPSNSPARLLTVT
ncbi:MAG: plastocyanin/azurin family copper-binding protein [Nitrososphaera sp.]